MNREDLSGRGVAWLAVLVALEIILYQASVPILLDEAYLLSWGLRPAAGYYDHPPLTGWVSAAILWFDRATGLDRPWLTARGFALALGAVSLVVLHRHLRIHAPDRSVRRLTATWVLIPATLLSFNIYVNDTLLVFLTLVFLLALHASWTSPRPAPAPMLLAALALALMLLTKYSAALIYLGVVAGLARDRRGRRFLLTRLGPVTLLAGVPFAWHLWWNAQNCAVNLAFNFAFREEAATGGPLLALAATLLLVSGLIAFQFLWDLGRGGLDRRGFFTGIFLATLAISLVIAVFRGNFGGNWAAPFGALAVLALAENENLRRIGTALTGSLTLTVALVIPALLVTMTLKTGILSPHKRLPEAASYRFTLLQDLGRGALTDELRALGGGRVFGSDHYGLTALLKLNGLGPAVTLGSSVYGRNDDLFADYAALDGKDFVLVPLVPGKAEDLASRFFADWQERLLRGPSGDFRVVLARGFDYRAFRAGILEPFIRDHYLKSPFPYRACSVTRYLQAP